MAVIKKSPMVIAIEMLGGVEGLVELWHLPERQVRKMLKQDPDVWMVKYTAAIVKATLIPFQTLLLVRGPVNYPEPQKTVKKRPKLRRVA
jgi:hypothetical protein